MAKLKINIIGAGLAGTEAAYQLARRGFQINLYESKRINKNPVQKQDSFAELVCSNSLRSDSLTNGVGLLKQEMLAFDSLIIKAAYASRVPAGGALAVDRQQFSNYVTTWVTKHPNVTLIDQEVATIDLTAITIIASGPLTTPSLQKEIQQLLGKEYFYFYDAAAPIIAKESIDFQKVYYKSRYDKGESKDYINCPMTRAEFERWVQELITAETVALREFEKEIYFEGCMPIEVMAKRGVKSLLFGPLKPVGLEKPNGEQPYAVIQLRQDDAIDTLYNVVGFQTNLKFPEQKRLLTMIPGLENANIVRYGVIHKNNFINSPVLLNQFLQLKSQQNVFFAGQITGVEDYVESAATGIISALNIANFLNNKAMLTFPPETMMGALINYIINASSTNFQPMKANFGIVPNLDQHFKAKVDKYLAYSDRVLTKLTNFIKNNKLNDEINF
ncbi:MULTISPECIES: methylenetetrahydrofolate--tRNA-(uracil(54)-C(5))-methyltransferase (FADH(2)-oxidizing) TrmFO [Spiroplasma]|uniref:methylenetetrahydrofolate--tRNA-(uracil(54)- C(5))-methyltransferase (FADH(2)-oxidizing) TrmFO n=1 Tax=Spiroplasma TaxID=2132 RepID=UPI0018DC9399|nr:MULTISPECIES: methylenetetrahydrofolate--tRNA-(uracil(54)-C(5))-methyltransferase (FADH(2)-oxidizing) TrmFO [Spiroplasma]MBH8622537.1 FADH(2)-oxidizing methylenetetrahydrofolate--tRNA-(uracil(54)-C(5))-methyltransferase TrmFO [Spiroplasma sp. hyd1]UNF62388.1 methylenetetrahydrofolate--tRNA-(uracil(54)-C(5))-methyltransferase (FADH(2)-oxidizing) TrmFO [Spiroplasma poulsonii]